MRKVQTNASFFLLPWEKLHVGAGHADRDLQHKMPGVPTGLWVLWRSRCKAAGAVARPRLALEGYRAAGEAG